MAAIGFVGEFIYLVRGDDEFKRRRYIFRRVPHQLRFARPQQGGRLRWWPAPSFTINLKQESYGVDISDDFNGADIGVIGGLGVEFFRIGIEGRGNWGLRNINTDGNVVETEDVHVRAARQVRVQLRSGGAPGLEGHKAASLRARGLEATNLVAVEASSASWPRATSARSRD